MTNALTTFDPNQVRTYSVGFDSLFDSLFDHQPIQTSNYPPYNIVKHSDENFTIEMAVAGFKKEDIEIESKENILTVSSLNVKDIVPKEGPTYLHRGISRRQFKKRFTLSNDVFVKDAKMEDGMLYIHLERIIPEEKRPRLIDIS